LQLASVASRGGPSWPQRAAMDRAAPAACRPQSWQCRHNPRAAVLLLAPEAVRAGCWALWWRPPRGRAPSLAPLPGRPLPSPAAPAQAGARARPCCNPFSRRAHPPPPFKACLEFHSEPQWLPWAAAARPTPLFAAIQPRAGCRPRRCRGPGPPPSRLFASRAIRASCFAQIRLSAASAAPAVCDVRPPASHTPTAPAHTLGSTFVPSTQGCKDRGVVAYTGEEGGLRMSQP
jgi:hypothetical protein